MLRTLQAILIAATVCAATLAVAHPAHYAMAVAGTKPVSHALPDKVYSAVAGGLMSQEEAADYEAPFAHVHK